MPEYAWRCTRCKVVFLMGDEISCKWPDFEVAVPYETGIKWEHPACPLELIRYTLFERFARWLGTL
jgi:hypothetical protein